MALPLFYSEQSLVPDFLTLDEDTSRHVVQVLRMPAGEALELTDGTGNLVIATIEDAHKRKCTVRVTGRSFRERNKRTVSVGISLLKNSTRFEWFLEKATEIGVSEIIPLLCDRTEKQQFRMERMKTIIITAMLQSQQYWLPALLDPTPYKKVVAEKNYDTRLIAHCEQDTRRHLNDFAGTSCQILIGPEGDFRRSEIEMALQSGYQPITLGNTRLRSETAGVVASTILCICQ